MKKFLLILIIGMLAFVACDTGTTGGGGTEEPPIEVLTWLDVVPEGFFQLVSIRDEGTFSRSVGDVTTINDVFVVFNDDGDVSLWYDDNDNGILEPEDYVGSAGSWELIGDDLFINGELFTVYDVEQNSWSMTMDISDQFEDCLGEAGYDVSGTRTFFYERDNPVYMTPQMLIVTSFPFVFSDRNETGLAYTLERSCSWWKTTYYLDEEEVLLDEIDGFYFTWGEVDIVLLTMDEGNQSLILVDGNVYYLTDEDSEFVFAEDAVYDMTITVQPNDVAYFSFVSRLDASDTFTVPAMIDYSLIGDVTIIAVDDVGGLIL